MVGDSVEAVAALKRKRSALGKVARKEALTETLQEQCELLHETFAEVLEDFALAQAIRIHCYTSGFI